MRSIGKFVLSALACISQLPFAYLAHESNSEKFLDTYPIPPKTPGSIDIDTSKTKKADLKTFKFYGGLDERVNVINTGKSVEARLDQASTVTSITGGPFSGLYKFHKLTFYWADNRTTAVHTTFNSQSVQLVAVVYFYKQNYSSFENAIQHRDGVGEVNLPVTIGGIENPFFITFANILRQIRKPGSKASTYLANTFQWYDGVFPFAKYYTYPGAYKDERTGHTFYCTTTVAYTTSSTFSLSHEQFKYTFESLKNREGNPLTNIYTPKPSKAPVIQATGTLQIIILTGKSLPEISPNEKELSKELAKE